MLVAMTAPPHGEYTQPGYPAYRPPPPRHPDAVTVLALGVASVVVLPLVGPVAWVMGSRVRKDIAASPGRWSGDDLVSVGYVLGIIGSVLCLLFVVLLLVFVAVALGVITGFG